MRRLPFLLALGAAACSHPSASAPSSPASVSDVLVAPPEANRFAEQAYLEGVADFRKGDFGSAAEKFSRCLTLVTTGQTAGGCMAGLELTRGELERAAGRDDRAAQQSYLEGVLFFQKGDFEKARASWTRCAQLASPDGPAAVDCRAGLERILQLDAPSATVPDGKK